MFNDISNAIKAGKMTEKSLDNAVARAFLTRFRLGEFDDQRNPFFQKYPESLLDCDSHRQSARKAVAASAVLLQNLEDALPLPTEGLKKVAVVGPWSDCKDRRGGYGGSMGYLNNYKVRNWLETHWTTLNIFFAVNTGATVIYQYCA